MTPEPDGAATPEHDSVPESPAADTTGEVAPPNQATEPTGSDEGLSPDEEPTTTGTIFIMILFLMALAGMWGIMYLTLLELR